MTQVLKKMASITALFPCKKLRRSSRLEMKEKLEIFMKDSSSSSIGYFEMLPLEVKFMLFSYLTVKDLSVLTITSKSVRNTVELYRGSGFAQQYILPYTVHHSAVISVQEQEMYSAQFQNIGLLIKRSTCLYSTRDRLKFVEQFLQRLLCFVHKDCTDPVKCVALSCFGKFFHMVIAGWDDRECSKAYEVVCQTSLMAKQICTVIKSRQGSYPGLELHVRLFFRRVFLQHCLSNYDKAFWLEQILKPFPMVHQARTLFLLFGPIHGDEIQWPDMCESTPATKEQARHCFGDLSNAFRVLHHYSKQWNEDDIISVLEELTISPEEWLSENTANLLYLCGECITLKVLSSKAINGRMSELANILTSLSLVCVRYDNNISFVTKLINLLCPIFENPKERVGFLHSIVDTFKEIILDIHEFSEGDDDSSRDLHHMLEAQTEFTKELVLLAFKAQGVVLNLRPILNFKDSHVMEE